MELSVLAEQNPWWKGKERIEEDYDILKWKKRKYRWMPKLLEEIKIESFSLHILLGPRQVGKTTAVKLLIKKLLEARDPKSLFYFNCEEVSDFKELLEIIETYFDFRERSEITSSCIFLDEVTSPREWYRAVKFIIDTGKCKDDVILITGSSSIGVKRQTELFPGRRGKGENFILLPLSFREFLRVTKPELFEKVEPVKEVSVKEFSKKAAKAVLFVKELNSVLERYFCYGGFPLSIEEEDKTEAKRTYLSWIKTEVLKAGRNDNIAREIIKSFLEKMQSPISWEIISKDIEIKSPKTVAAYMQLLRSIFSIVLLYHADISEKTIKFGKNKKVHVIDPLLLEIFEDWCMVKLKNKESILAESLVASHLARYFAYKYKTTTLDEGLFYWRNSTEVDVILNDNGYKGFEVKWSDKFDIKEPAHLKEYLVVSKNKFSTKPLIIPLSVFLSLLDV